MATETELNRAAVSMIRNILNLTNLQQGWLEEMMDKALVYERRATVKLIRERLADNHNIHGAESYRLDEIEAILDEEAARRANPEALQFVFP